MAGLGRANVHQKTQRGHQRAQRGYNRRGRPHVATIDRLNAEMDDYHANGPDLDEEGFPRTAPLQSNQHYGHGSQGHGGHEQYDQQGQYEQAAQDYGGQASYANTSGFAEPTYDASIGNQVHGVPTPSEFQQRLLAASGTISGTLSQFLQQSTDPEMAEPNDTPDHMDVEQDTSAWPTQGELVLQETDKHCKYCQGKRALKEYDTVDSLFKHIMMMHVHQKRGDMKGVSLSPYMMTKRGFRFQIYAHRHWAKLVEQEANATTNTEPSSPMNDIMVALKKMENDPKALGKVMGEAFFYLAMNYEDYGEANNMALQYLQHTGTYLEEFFEGFKAQEDDDYLDF